MTTGASLLVITVGAILYFAVEATFSGIDIKVAGVILMVVGAIGLVIGVAQQLSNRPQGGQPPRNQPPR